MTLTFLKRILAIFLTTALASVMPSSAPTTTYVIVLPPTIAQNFGKTLKNDLSVERSGKSLVIKYETRPVRTEAIKILPIERQKVLFRS